MTLKNLLNKIIKAKYTLFPALLGTGFFQSKNLLKYRAQYLIFKPLSYCFEETIGFDVKALFASRPVSRIIR